MKPLWRLTKRHRETLQPCKVLETGVYWIVSQRNGHQDREDQRYKLKSTSFTYIPNWQFIINNIHPVVMRNPWVRFTSIFVTSRGFTSLWRNICIHRLARVVYQQEWRVIPYPSHPIDIVDNRHELRKLTVKLCTTGTSGDDKKEELRLCPARVPLSIHIETRTEAMVIKKKPAEDKAYFKKRQRRNNLS